VSRPTPSGRGQVAGEAPEASGGANAQSPSGGRAASRANSSADDQADLASIRGDLTTGQRALESGDLKTAGDFASRAEEALLNLGAATPGPRATLRSRLDSLLDRIAVEQLSADIGRVTAEVKVARDAGEYNRAIALLQGLVTSVDGAPSSRREKMMDLLSVFRIEETVKKIREACEFERQYMGRTEPCGNR
jgi:hypothetical protein